MAAMCHKIYTIDLLGKEYCDVYFIERIIFFQDVITPSLRRSNKAGFKLHLYMFCYMSWCYQLLIEAVSNKWNASDMQIFIIGKLTKDSLTTGGVA